MDNVDKINAHELAEYLAEAESKKTCSDLSTELYKTRGKEFCVGLILHLTMHVSGSYSSCNSKTYPESEDRSVGGKRRKKHE